MQLRTIVCPLLSYFRSYNLRSIHINSFIHIDIGVEHTWKLLLSIPLQPFLYCPISIFVHDCIVSTVYQASLIWNIYGKSRVFNSLSVDVLHHDRLKSMEYQCKNFTNLLYSILLPHLEISYWNLPWNRLCKYWGLFK